MPDARRSTDAGRAGRAAVRVVDRAGAAHRCDARRRARPRTTETRRRHMQITSFEDFKELAQRGTFVPVYKEIVADLLTPVSAFLKIAEHSDYAFLLESVEGGEHVGRYSFLGKDPFLVLRARGNSTAMERAGVVTETTDALVPTLRKLMADFRSPYVRELPRFTGGAVGFLGYDAASWFEPVPMSQGTDGPAGATDQAGFMLFDTVL